MDPYDAQERCSANTKRNYDTFHGAIPGDGLTSDRAQYLPINETTKAMKIQSISGTEFRRRLREGLEISEWFSFPECDRRTSHRCIRPVTGKA